MTPSRCFFPSNIVRMCKQRATHLKWLLGRTLKNRTEPLIVHNFHCWKADYVLYWMNDPQRPKQHVWFYARLSQTIDSLYK